MERVSYYLISRCNANPTSSISNLPGKYVNRIDVNGPPLKAMFTSS